MLIVNWLGTTTPVTRFLTVPARELRRLLQAARPSAPTTHLVAN
ncbi:hypothetical protein CDS [Bradyrhizobium sp.]|nr:hypothetical protein CDS [Bradyrhizobium sp.]